METEPKEREEQAKKKVLALHHERMTVMYSRLAS